MKTANVILIGNRLSATVNESMTAGETLIIGLNHAYGLTGATSMTIGASGVFTAEFRYSQQPIPVDWSGWGTGTVTLSPDLPTFIEVRISTEEAIRVQGIEFTVTRDTAYSEPRIWGEDNISILLPEIIRQCVEDFSPKIPYGLSGERPGFAFHTGNPETCIEDESRPTVWVHNIRVSENEEQTDIGAFARVVSLQIGIRRNCSKEHDLHFERMKNLLRSHFGKGSQQYIYDLDLNGIQYRGVSLSAIGMKSIRHLGDAAITPPAPLNKCGNNWFVMTIETTINFKKYEQE